MREGLFLDSWTENLQIIPPQWSHYDDLEEDHLDSASSMHDVSQVFKLFESVEPDTVSMSYSEGALLDLDNGYGEVLIMEQTETQSELSNKEEDTDESQTSTTDRDEKKTKKPANPQLYFFMPQQQDDDAYASSTPVHSPNSVPESPTKSPQKKQNPNTTKPVRSTKIPVVNTRTCKSQPPGTNRAPTAKITKRKKKTAISLSADTWTAAVEVASSTTTTSTNTSLDAQCSCCITGCQNAVTNRLRFSLRRPCTFKEDFIGRGWNKICSYHYFNDLYLAKKVQQQ